MGSTKTPKRVIKKRLKNVDKAIIEIAQMKFKNFEEKEEKLDALIFFKESNIEGSKGVATKMTIYIYRVILYIFQTILILLNLPQQLYLVDYSKAL